MVIAPLAKASPAFSSAAPEMGATAILSRFQQLNPKILMLHTDLSGRTVEATSSEKLDEIIRGLPTLDALIVLDDGPLPGGIEP